MLTNVLNVQLSNSKKKKNPHLNKKVEEKLDSEIKEATVSFEISIVEK